jgi:hypothetical protein
MLQMRNWYLHELVYTIGDEGMSYTGFIMTLRRILADHPNHKGEDIVDGHEDPNLSFTRQHAVLTCLGTNSYVRIKLQMAATGAFTVLNIVLFGSIGYFLVHAQIVPNSPKRAQ